MTAYDYAAKGCHAALQARERVAPEVRHPGMAELMEPDRDDQEDELEGAPAEVLEVHLSYRSLRGAGRNRSCSCGRGRTSGP